MSDSAAGRRPVPAKLAAQAGWDLADIGLADREDTLPEQDGEFIADVRTLLATFRKRGTFTARIPKPRRTGAAPDSLPANTATAAIPPRGATGERKPGLGSAWSPAPLRHASLTAQVIPFRSRTVEPPPVEPPDVLCSTNLDLSLREVAGSRS